jgi:hypothetical protein
MDQRSVMTDQSFFVTILGAQGYVVFSLFYLAAGKRPSGALPPTAHRCRGLHR